MSEIAVLEAAEAVEGERAPEEAAPGGLSANALKLIAIIAMLIDHIAHVFVPDESLLATVMHFIGRTTGPIMFFMVAQGYRLTRDKNRYTLRLLIFAAISYIPFIYAFSGQLPNADTWMDFNVIWTIFISLVAIRIRNEMKNPVLKVVLLLLLIYPAYIGDWYTLGYLIMLAFDYFYGNFKNQAVAYCVITLTYGGIMSMMLAPMFNFLWGVEVNYSAILYSLQELGMFVPIILLYFYNGRKGRGGKLAKWGFYIFYPLHLLVLGLIKQFLVGA